MHETDHSERSHQSSSISASRIRGEKLGESTFTDPLHHPEYASDSNRVRRAWAFLAMTFFLPGSVQLVAGRRGVGKFALKVLAGVWIAIALLVVLWFVRRTVVLSLLTNNFFLFLLVGILIALAVGWVLLFLDTLRIIRVQVLPEKARVPLVLAMVGLMVIVGGGLGYSAYIAGVGRGALNNIFSGSGDLKASDGRYNILLMGGDAGADRVGRRPDSMTVVSIDAKSGQAITISLPRNTQNAIFSQDSPLWKVYPEGFNCGDECILNALYPQVTADYADLYPGADDPGAEAMMDAASGITGLSVNNYVLVDMAGFEQLVDALGGITIDVGGRVPIGGGTNEITGEPNPIEGYIEPGVQHLDGFHALWYARSREGASDYDRQARQRCVQAAMLKQLDPANVLTKFADITAAGEQIIETNIPSAGLSALADVALKSKNHALIQYAAGPPYYGELFPTYPDFAQFQADLQGVIADSAQGIQPSPATNAAGASTPSHSEAGSESGSVTIETVARIKTISELTANGTCSVP